MSTGVGKESAEPLSESGRLNSQVLTLWRVEAPGLQIASGATGSPSPSQSLCESKMDGTRSTRLANFTWYPTGVDQPLYPPTSIKYTHIHSQNTGGRHLEDKERMKMDLLFQLRLATNTHTQTHGGTILSLSVHGSEPRFLQLLSPHWSWISVTFWQCMLFQRTFGKA